MHLHKRSRIFRERKGNSREINETYIKYFRKFLTIFMDAKEKTVTVQLETEKLIMLQICQIASIKKQLPKETAMLCCHTEILTRRKPLIQSAATSGANNKDQIVLISTQAIQDLD